MWIGLEKLKRNIERASRVSLPEFPARHTRNRLDFGVKNHPRERVELNFSLLTLMDIAVILFWDFGGKLHTQGVNHLRDGAAWLGLISCVIVGDRHAGEE